MARSNDLAFARNVTARLAAAGVLTWVFGGWAEELLRLRPARAHRDLDLLYPAADFTDADTFMASGSQVTEITGKRFPHKRAFLDDGIMVELLLVQSPSPGKYVTIFWGDTPHQWPHDVISSTAGGLRVASAASLRSYRASHPRLRWSPTRQAGNQDLQQVQSTPGPGFDH